MANQQNQKLKMLKIMEYLRMDTDEEHPISMPEILRRLEADGIPAERKSVYTDLAILEDFGLDIIQSKNRTNVGYYLGSRDFELPEVKLLVDAVSASK
ncbi:MAG: WYL domain-containing protein, partial [Lachnospiraceae bacterium]|nr:WYL domain-containing protein [Lachnospiraceae bacterium]